MAKDPNAVASKWAQNLANSTQAMTDGVQSVQVAPGVLAARQSAAWLAGVQAAQNKWASNVAKVPLAEWQQSMIDKAVPRIAQGAQSAEPKMATFMAKLLPAIAQVKSTLPARGNLEQNIARSAAFARGMSKFSAN